MQIGAPWESDGATWRWREVKRTLPAAEEKQRAMVESGAGFDAAPEQTGSGPAVDVFLGGACGATTWRKDVAIPYLEREGLTYWNPQARVRARRRLSGCTRVSSPSTFA